MNLLTKEKMIQSVASRFKFQYQEGSGKWFKDWTQIIYESLEALPPHATEEDIEGIIGSDSWTQIKCNECNQIVDKAIQLGYSYEEIIKNNIDDTGFIICKDCLIKALDLL